MNFLRQTCRLLLSLLLVTNLRSQTVDGTLPSVSLVNTFAVQTDGKILIGGDFTSVGGVARSYIARINPDGSLDTSFNPGASGQVRALAVQADGKILMGGTFVTAGGGGRNNIARLNADGTLDTGFNPNANNSVNAIAVQSDGNILIGGNFSTVGGTTRSRFARLSANGTLDTTFTPSFPNVVNAFAVQRDGKILACHTGASVLGNPLRTVMRFNTNGTNDSSFLPEVYSGVHALALQPDGRIVIGGSFTTVGGVARNRIARLHSDGTLDAGFDPNSNGDLRSLALQADGKILLGGFFTTLGGEDRRRLARLNADGTVDISFSYNVSSGSITALSVLPDGKVLVAGSFFARLTNDTAASSSLALSGSSQIDWTRGGSAPEVGQVTFENWNGSGWTLLGNALPVSGGWRLTGLSLPADGWIRARGQVPGGGSQASSSGLIEQIISYGTPVSPDIELSTEDGTTYTHGTASVNFAPVIWPTSSSVGKTLTITNTGNATLSGLGISLQGANAGDFSMGSLPATTLAPGGNMSIPLTFFPQGVTAGLKNALITISSNDPDETSFAVDLKGAFLQSDPAFNPGSNGQVLASAVQPDKRVLVGGGFTTMGGIARKYAARLNDDGTLDAAFDPSASTSVFTMAVQQDGKVVLGGSFTTMGGVARNDIARLNEDGTLDTAFDPNASAQVTSLALQADGKILMAGSFTTVSGVACNYIARLNADGTLDTSFNPNPSGGVQCLAVQPDGKILIGGFFSTVGGTTRPHLARLNANGSLDSGFTPDASINDSTFSIALQPDGKILVARRNTVLRLNSNGTLDSGFIQGAGDGIIFSLLLQADGKFLAGGQFTKIGAVTRNRIARFNADGSLDTSFDPNANGVVNSLAIQADGKIIVGGLFSNVGGGEDIRLDRLLNNIPATSSLTITGATQIDWQRGGSAPEVSQVIFERWNGSAWVKLGDATRVSGGWRMTGLSLGADGRIRARGRTASGYYTGSSGLIEQTAGYGPCDIAIEGPLGTNLATGSTYDYGTRANGSATPVTLVVKNEGFSPLSLGSVSIGGPNAAEFVPSTVGMATSLPPGGQTTIQVTFSPTSTGAKSATLSITSNDGDENPFTIVLTGAGNAAPTFAGYSASTAYQTPVTISLSKLLSKASDPDGDLMSVTAAGPASTQAGGAVLQSGSILYTPHNGFSGTDTFPVTISDALGASVSGTVTISVTAGPNSGGQGSNSPQLTMLRDGGVGIAFQGIPGRQYQIQRSPDMTPGSWVTLATITAARNGVVSYNDATPLPGSAFYRLRKP